MNINSRVFDQAVPGSPVHVQDFSVIDTGARIIETYDCIRNAEPALSPPNSLNARIMRKHRNSSTYINLNWQSGSAKIDVYLDGAFRGTVSNVGSYSEKPGSNPKPSYVVCNFNTSHCSNAAIALPNAYIDPPLPRQQSRENKY